MAEANPYERAVDALNARGPGRMLPDLSRITRLAGLMGDPQLAYPSVHVTATNGKGSIVRMVGTLCSAAGMSAGTYTSPHLQSVRERFTFAGRHISPRRFAEVHDEVAVLADLLDAEARQRHGDDADRITYFEFLTAMAFGWFADIPVDVGIFEVGMGGRFDATNLVRGDVAVIGEIDLDHPELGPTRVDVAGEKSGIIKPGSRVVSAAQRPEVAAVIEAAAVAAGAEVTWFGPDVAVEERAVAVGGQLLTLRVGDRVVEDVLLPLHGAHQARNAALALAAFASLTGEAFGAMDDELLRRGLGAVVVPGRLEVVHREPTVVVDGAHNPHGAQAAATALAESFGFRELVLVAACLDDKDVEGILRPFASVASHVIVTEPPSPRAASLERIEAAALAVWEGSGTVVEVAGDLSEALDLAETVAGPGDGVLVAGSLVTVGAARERYLPGDDLDDDDEVVLEPDDEDGPLEEDEVDELSDLLADDTAFRAAIEDLLEDEDLLDDDAEPDQPGSD